MKTKVSEASGVVLDWMVTKADGCNSDPLLTYEGNGRKWIVTAGGFTIDYTDPAQGFPIIEREGICLGKINAGYWMAFPEANGDTDISGPTPLIAAMRCYVTSKLGDEVDVPAELLS